MDKLRGVLCCIGYDRQHCYHKWRCPTSVGRQVNRSINKQRPAIENMSSFIFLFSAVFVNHRSRHYMFRCRDDRPPPPPQPQQCGYIFMCALIELGQPHAIACLLASPVVCGFQMIIKHFACNVEMEWLIGNVCVPGKKRKYFEKNAF